MYFMNIIKRNIVQLFLAGVAESKFLNTIQLSKNQVILQVYIFLFKNVRCQFIIIMQYNFSINTRCFYSMKHVYLSNLSAFIYRDSDNCLSLEITDR